jgi:hypothetical protein
MTMDTAQLVLSGFRSAADWAIVPLSFAQSAQRGGNFSIQRLCASPPQHIIYKLTHRQPKLVAEQSLQIFDRCLAAVLGRNEAILMENGPGAPSSMAFRQ